MTALAAVALFAQATECQQILQRGQQLFETRSFPVAAVEFERALTVCPDRAAILVRLGQIRYLLGKDPEAEQALKEAIRLKPNDAAAHYALGRIYYQLNRFPEAVEQYAKVLELDPKHYRAHDNLALCYAALQKDPDALRHFFVALDLVQKDHKEYDWAHANLANFFLDRNQYEKAFQLAAEAAQRNPNAARNFFLTGKALVKLEKDDLALRWLERSVALDPSYPEPHYLLGQTYRKLGRQEDAARMLEKFKQLSQQPRPRR